MEALYLLIPLSVLAVLGAAWVFLWMSDSGQFDDMDGPAWSVLHDDDRTGSSSKNNEAATDSEGRGSADGRAEAAAESGVRDGTGDGRLRRKPHSRS